MALTRKVKYRNEQILNQLFDPETNTFTVATSSGGSDTLEVAASTATDTVVKASPGRLCRVLATATGTNPMTIHDNASAGSAVVIGALPASPAVGTTYDFNLPAASGITVKGHASNPGVTISFA